MNATGLGLVKSCEPTSTYSTSIPLKVGIIYCTSKVTIQGRETERLADCEILEVADAVQLALEGKGFVVEKVDLHPDRFHDLFGYDVIFNLAESIAGYPLTEFQVAEKLEQANIVFTGTGSISLQNCLNKATTKVKLLEAGFPTPSFQVFSFDTPIFCQLRYPVFVKPVHEDGSIGITENSVARNLEELTRRIRHIHQVYCQDALVEEFIFGRDITASILGNGEHARVLPLSECTYQKQNGTEFLTFEAKWVEESEGYRTAVAVCPCKIEPVLELKIKDLALRASQLLDCRDYTRVDFRVNQEQPYVLEINPNPCINPDDSGFVRCCNAAGINYQEMILRILKCAIEDRNIIPV